MDIDTQPEVDTELFARELMAKITQGEWQFCHSEYGIDSIGVAHKNWFEPVLYGIDKKLNEGDGDPTEGICIQANYQVDMQLIVNAPRIISDLLDKIDELRSAAQYAK